MMKMARISARRDAVYYGQTLSPAKVRLVPAEGVLTLWPRVH